MSKSVNLLLRSTPHAGRRRFAALWLLLSCWAMLAPGSGIAASIQLNSGGGTNASNGLHFYIEDTSHIQVRRLNNTGQVYSPGAVPPSSSLDNGVFLRANGTLYGPSHTVSTFNIPMYSTYSISATTPVNPATLGIPQTATQNLGIASGPQVSIVWKYVLPYDFITADVTLTIPASYAVSAANPVRYYHVFDTYLGGSDQGCGVTFVDANGKRVVGTYPPASGNSCPSSTAIPAGVSIVESFRERSGKTFSHYCTNAWSNFWGTATSSTACAIRRLTSLNDAVTTTYIDTGIGVEYDFTAAGTYTFSYDFVIGSPTVPPYDHLEIQHDGSSTLCPDNVTVLACAVATVPCPPANYVVSGALSGAVTTTPVSPAVTKTPATFSIGSSAPTAIVALQADSPGGTYTLGSSGLSSIPLNGTKCWNTASSTASCTFTATNTPCIGGFECMETGLAYTNQSPSPPSARNPLYTKLVGTDFKFDVVALQTSGVQSSGYTSAGNVTVELFDDSASPQPACSAYVTPVETQSITFTAADSGRKTLPTSFNLSKAYRKLRCRVRDTNITPTVYGCSSDVFSVRPTAFSSVSSSDANADNAGLSASATPAVKAGATFALTAGTGVVGYNDKPKANAALLEWLNVPSGGRASPGTGVLAGDLTFSTAASAANGNGARGSFTYDEVGYFRFKVDGIYDDTFASYSGDKANGDCVSGSATPSDDFSNAASDGKYGCHFGNVAVSNYFGRFIPDHFDTTVTQVCVNTSPVPSFTYSGQPFPVQITARNSSGGVTQNYDQDLRVSPDTANSFSNAVTLSAWDVATGAIANAGLGALTPAQPPALALNTAFVSGVASLTTPVYTFTDSQTAPVSVRIRAIEPEVSSLRVPAALTVEGAADIRSGRARLSNAYGSELLDLPVLFRTEFWNGNGWVLNSADTCTGDTTLGAANAVSLGLASVPAGLPTCVLDKGSPGLSGVGCATAAPVTRRFKEGATPGVGFAGEFNLWLLAPGANSFGTTTINATVPAWLGSVPATRATFGRYKTPLIYRRENY